MGNYRNKNTMYCTNIIINNFSKDARLPVQLQRAMAKEAEAARDARAKVQIFIFFIVFPTIFIYIFEKFMVVCLYYSQLLQGVFYFPDGK